jgi:hypothetical protein
MINHTNPSCDLTLLGSDVKACTRASENTGPGHAIVTDILSGAHSIRSVSKNP